MGRLLLIIGRAGESYLALPRAKRAVVDIIIGPLAGAGFVFLVGVSVDALLNQRSPILIISASVWIIMMLLAVRIHLTLFLRERGPK
jgi:hypothetical protein